VALSAAQASLLTSDIVVLETTTMTLANGQTAQVLKPQVYLKPRAGDLQANGNLMAAQNLNLQAGRDLALTTTTASNGNTQGSRTYTDRVAQGNIALPAAQDLSVRAASVQSQSGALTATAAGQVRIEAGQARQTVDETHQSPSKSLLSSKTTTKRDTYSKILIRNELAPPCNQATSSRKPHHPRRVSVLIPCCSTRAW
jgi:filamentous hemagglutinin